MKEMKEMKDFSAYGKENKSQQAVQSMLITRQISLFSEITQIQMMTNEHASERFGSYVNALNTMKRK